VALLIPRIKRPQRQHGRGRTIERQNNKVPNKINPTDRYAPADFLVRQGISMKIIITDLTRFSNKEIVCIAGINPETNECIRPLPYIQKASCQRTNILPGAIIKGDFTPCTHTAPHTEDRNSANLKFLGPCSTEQFKSVLERSSDNSVEEGFGVTLSSGQKHVPHDSPPEKSIITLSIDPTQFKIFKDSFNPSKLRVTFTDNSGISFRYLSITDLGFFEYAERHAANDEICEINDFIHSQEKLYIRLGLSRAYQINDGRNGFWFQVNGIYTFPEYVEEIRCYS